MDEKKPVGESSSGSDSRVVVKSFSATKNFMRNRAVFDLVIAAVVFLVLLGSYLIFHKSSNPLSGIPAKGTIKATQLSEKVGTLIQQKNYTAAQQTVESQSGNANSATSLALQAEVEESQGNYKQALTTEETIATKYGLNSGLAVTIAQIAIRVGNDTVATAYYAKAIAILQAEPQTSQTKAQIQDINQFISQLQSAPAAKT